MKKRRYKFKYDEQDFEFVFGVYVERREEIEYFRRWPLFWRKHYFENHIVILKYKLLEVVKPIKCDLSEDINKILQFPYGFESIMMTKESADKEEMRLLEKDINPGLLEDLAEYIERNMDYLKIKETLEVIEEEE